MSRPIAASAYVKALLLLSGGPEAQNARLRALEAIEAAFQAHPQLLTILQAPDLTSLARRELLQRFLIDGADKHLLSFVDLLIDRRRIDHLSEIARRYRLEIDRSQGILSAKVTSARTLERGEVEILERKLKERYPDKQIMITVKVDSAAIGGIAIEMDGRIVDGSIKTRLGKLKEKLLALPL